MDTRNVEANEQRGRFGRRRGAQGRAGSVQLAEEGGWIRRMIPFLRNHTRDLVLVFVAAITSQMITALIPFTLKFVVDDAILDDTSPLLPFLGILLALGVVRYGLAFARRYYGGRLGIAVEYDLRNAVYDHLQRLDFARHDEMQTGQLVSRSNTDVRMVQALLGFLPQMSGNVMFFLVSLGFMFWLAPSLTVVALVIVPVLFIMVVRMRKVVYPSSWEAQAKAAEVANVVDEAVSGVRVVKGFGQERRELNRLINAATILFGARMRNVRITARRQASMQMVPNLGQLSILALGGYLAIQGDISVGVFLAFMSYLVQFVTPVRMTANMLVQAQTARAAAERIFELLDSTPTIHEKPGAVGLDRIDGKITFDNVSFGYMRSEPVLKGFNLQVRPGEVVALVGGSGSGKSTVALLLPRFYDVQEGSVRVDDIDVRDAKIESLRSQIGVVFEESFLFSDSIRDNIAYGRPEATDDDVIRAAKAAEAHEFIMRLPDGYDTLVGERGLGLSGGQRQRIALARALITDPRMLILDDATSSIDAKIEEEIHDTLRRIMPGRSVILVAHRRSSLDLADRIVVMDEGAVVDYGTHDELFARCKLYHELLAGPEGSIEGSGEVLTTGGITESAWPSQEEVDKMISNTIGQQYAAQRAETAGLGAGGRGGGGMGAMRLAEPPTPELMEAIAKLPPVIDEPVIDPERQMAPEPDFRLRRFLGPMAKPLILGLFLVAADALTLLAGPRLIMAGMDQGVVQENLNALWATCAAFFLVIMLNRVVHWYAHVYTGRIGQRLLYSLRIRVFAHLQRLGLDYYDREMTGRIMTRMTSDIEALQNLLQTGMLQAVIQLVTFFGTAIIMFTMDFQLAGYVLLITPALIYVTQWFRRRSDHAYLAARDRLALVNANFAESISGVRVAQAFVREGRNMKDFRQLTGQYFDARLEGQRLSAMFFPFVELMSAVAIVIVLGVGAQRIDAGAVTAGALVAFVLYINVVFTPIQQLSQVFDTYQQAKAAMTRLRELLATSVSIPQPENAIVPSRIRGEIRFEDVHFRYVVAREPALEGASLRVNPGETVALVGETGAGKSTIVKLIARFYDPTSGRILVDGNPLNELDLAAYRSQLGYVPQEAFLFTGTIRDNIAYGRPDASEEEVEAAARAVGAHDFIVRLPYGYRQPVTERGRSLAQGQRQLIALARALLVDPAILILDEATANLDLGTEARVARAMGLVSEGRTTILIAHRLQTAQRADRIFVVDGGIIVEEGTHDELLTVGGRYAELWRSFALDPAQIAEPESRQIPEPATVPSGGTASSDRSEARATHGAATPVALRGPSGDSPSTEARAPGADAGQPSVGSTETAATPAPVAAPADRRTPSIEKAPLATTVLDGVGMVVSLLAGRMNGRRSKGS